MKYVIEFRFPVGEGQESICYAGLMPDNAMGFAPTVKTAIQTDREVAERLLQNGYGGLRDIGQVIPLTEVEV